MSKSRNGRNQLAEVINQTSHEAAYTSSNEDQLLVNIGGKVYKVTVEFSEDASELTNDIVDKYLM